MKIDPKDLNRGNRHALMGSALVPRTVALISTLSENGVPHVAPYSMCSIVSYNPVPYVFFSAGRRNGVSKKDTSLNAERDKEFVINMVDEDILEKANKASAFLPRGTNKFETAGFTPTPSDLVRPPRVAESPISFECRVTDILHFGKPDIATDMIIGEVLRIHVKDELYKKGVVDVAALHIVARMGVSTYSRTRDLFDLRQPPD